jgi:chromosome segregation ATPase
MKTIIESLEAQVKNLEHEIQVNENNRKNVIVKLEEVTDDIYKAYKRIEELKQAINVLNGAKDETTSENKKTKRKGSTT